MKHHFASAVTRTRSGWWVGNVALAEDGSSALLSVDGLLI